MSNVMGNNLGDTRCIGCSKIDQRSIACVLLGEEPRCGSCVTVRLAAQVVKSERKTRTSLTKIREAS